MGIESIDNNAQRVTTRPLYISAIDTAETIAKANTELAGARMMGNDSYEIADVLAKTEFSLAGHPGTMQFNSDTTFDVDIPGIGKGTFQVVPDGNGGRKLESRGEIDPELKTKLEGNPTLKAVLGAAYVANTLKKDGMIPVYDKEVAPDTNLKIEVGKNKASFRLSGKF